MIWDFAIVYMGVSLAIAGWCVGIINSWPAPIAMLLATACTQVLYANLGAFMLDQTRLPGDLSFFISYVMIWIVFEGLFETLLLIMIPIKKRFDAGVPSRVGGAIVGLMKGAVVLTFAAAAAGTAVTMPPPPNEGPAIVGWMRETTRASTLLRCTRVAAGKLPMGLAKRVVSEDSPIFRPTFRDTSGLDVDAYKARKWHDLFEGLRNLDQEVSEL